VADKEVLAFSISNSSLDWMGYDWGLVTTVAMFDVIGQGDSELPPPLTDSGDLSQLGLICTAHAHGAKAVYGVAYPVALLGDSETRTEWVQAWLQFVQETFADGINIDIEEPILAGENATRESLNLLLRETVDAFRNSSESYQISFDVAWSPDCIDERCYDFEAIAEITDYALVMSYDLQSQIPLNRCIAGPNSPLQSVTSGIVTILQHTLFFHPTYLSMYPSIDRSIYPPILSIYPLSTYLSIHLS